MKTRSILLNLSIIISTVCLGAAYLIAGYWLILPALLVLAAAWYIASHKPGFWLAALSLIGCVILAAFGIVIDLSMVLIIFACTSALVAWELITFKHSVNNAPPSKPDPLLGKIHLQSLALAASAGLVLALISSLLHLQLPFGIIALLVLFAVGGLVFGLQQITKS